MKSKEGKMGKEKEIEPDKIQRAMTKFYIKKKLIDMLFD